MIRYFPFSPVFDIKMGTSPMKEEDSIIEVDEHYHHEVQLKESLLTEDHKYYYNNLPGSEQAEWDAVEMVLHDLVKLDPENFHLDKRGDRWFWQNRLTGLETSFVFGDDSTLPFSPLDWIGRQVQEDLILLNPEGIVSAGQLCFPSGWSLNEKLGKQFLDVHTPLPAVTQNMIQSANKFMERIPLGKSFMRNNWGFRLGDQLDMSSKYSALYRKRLSDELPLLSLKDFGQKVFLRVEHQTLTRLPRSGYVLFTIHTHHNSLDEVVEDYQRTSTLLSFLKGTPPELIEYKVMTSMYSMLIRYLEERNLVYPGSMS
jgi:hypothetical protein